MPLSPRSRRAAALTSESTTNNKRESAHPHPGLLAYEFHGVSLSVKGNHGVGDCPFCDGTDKFSVDVDSGLWRCWVCGGGTDQGGGNSLVFLRHLYTKAVGTTPHQFLHAVTVDRRLCDVSTVMSWGVCRSPITPNYWLVPGYGTDGRLDQLYKRVQIRGSDNVWSWRLLPTPGIWPEGKVHALHMAHADFDLSRPRVDIMEGPWDGAAMWEVVQTTAGSGDTNVIAVPGCNVWRDEWSAMCRGKDVVLWFDSDHPRVNGSTNHSPGQEGMKRIAKRLAGIASSVSCVMWGPDGYDPSLPDGWDVRDALSGSPGPPTAMSDRHVAMCNLILKVDLVPAEWSGNHTINGRVKHIPSADVEPQPCDRWSLCESAWMDALEWRDELGKVMTVMLAVAASTKQSGDNQLFLQVIGDPGSAKTRLCKGMLVSRMCKLLLHLRSFHSGYKVPGDDEADCSLVSRINGLCLITPEADALHIGMNLEQINSQVRQIFDGESGNTYGNSSTDRHYKGLRSPWIQAGTPALMDKDQSRLGDRFLRVRLEQPDEEVKRAIMMRALDNELMAVNETSNGTSASIIPPKLRLAYALTGGYVDWLFAHIEEEIAKVAVSREVKDRCLDMAEFTADMRARPNEDKRKTETHHSKELPTRLISQFGRLAKCLAVVLNKRTVDRDVVITVRKVALDTAHGHTLNIVQWMCGQNPHRPGESYQDTGGIPHKRLAAWCNMTEERMQNYLVFLRKIGVVQLRRGHNTVGAWILTERVHDMYRRICSY